MNVISSEQARGRGKLKISGERELHYLEKISWSREGWTVMVTLYRIALLSSESQREFSTRVSVRATFTLQWCYRISRRRCNRRCNLCLVFRTSAHGLRHVYTHIRIHSTSHYIFDKSFFN